MRKFEQIFTMTSEYTAAHATELDEQDQLIAFRRKFFIPPVNGRDCIYLCGNSLGLQPVTAADALKQELDDWAKLGVEGHLHARNPWLHYHQAFAQPLAKLCGAKPTEVVAMNGLTANLHFLMASFYKPSKSRFRIICEGKPFPSDIYAFQSQAQWHGLNPNDVIREVKPRQGEYHVRNEDMLAAIHEEGEKLALVLVGAVNYYIGQVFNINEITKATHEVGAYAGFDLAHAIGNVALNLHEWNVDFAAWCSYKYLNSGPGGVAGVFIHEKHATDTSFPRLTGWWGHDVTDRFKMLPEFKAIPTAEGWQLSNAPVFSMAVHKASLDIFMEAGFEQLVEKSKKLTAYLNDMLVEMQQMPEFEGLFSIITPHDRGCQLSLLFHRDGKKVFDYITQQGVIADWREPDVIRIAPVPLYNTFTDVFRFVSILKRFNYA